MYGLIDRVTQPEYTGTNRCLPCTVLNIVLVLAAATVVSVWSPAGGVGFFGAAMVVIYLRGYLVPGTPTITKRYLPEAILKWFGKAPSARSIDEPVSVDPEQVLRDAGAVIPCRNGAEICLTKEFRTAWHERDEPGGEDIDIYEICRALYVPLSGLEIEDIGDGLVAVSEETVIHQWPSRAALTADLSAAGLLEDRHSDWDGLTPSEKGAVLASLRVFREACPACNGHVRLDQEVVESCCRAHDVVVSNCRDCGKRLFEMEWQDTDSSSKKRETPEPTEGAPV